MAIILVFVIIICFTLLGYKLASYYINRKKFFSSLELLLSTLELEVVFSQEKLKNIIERNIDTISSKELVIVCSNVCENLNNKTKIDDEIFKNTTILREDEKDLLLKFFLSLGRLDATSQGKEIKTYAVKFGEYYNQASDECKKYAGLFIKLGLIVGLLVCLLII